jgi:hypothetical protein
VLEENGAISEGVLPFGSVLEAFPTQRLGQISKKNIEILKQSVADYCLEAKKFESLKNFILQPSKRKAAPSTKETRRQIGSLCWRGYSCIHQQQSCGKNLRPK